MEDSIKKKNTTLKSILNFTGSQWSCVKTGVMCSLFRLSVEQLQFEPSPIKVETVNPTHRELQQSSQEVPSRR